MKLELKEKKENKVIERQEMEYILSHEGQKNPTYTEIRPLIQAEIGKETFMIRIIKPMFGSAKSQVTIHAYDNKEKMDNYEPEYVKKRNFKQEKKSEVKE